MLELNLSFCNASYNEGLLFSGIYGLLQNKVIPAYKLIEFNYFASVLL